MKEFIFYQSKLPSVRILSEVTKGKNFILIYDKKLLQRKEFKLWSRQFKQQIGVDAGEKLKSLGQWQKYLKVILPMLSGYSRGESVLVSVGGGTVGDFSGFMASVLKRGIGFVQIPSTWLAAVDSAHGGKNALNVCEYKNQVGTFYNPQATFCVWDLLKNQSKDQIDSAMGEAIKILFLRGGNTFLNFRSARSLNQKVLWEHLPELVNSKLNIVKEDPFETVGKREVLNLGHTLGHALETEFNLSHGIAVLHGLEFSLDWSLRLKILKQKDFQSMKNLVSRLVGPRPPAMSIQKLKKRISQDKKAQAGTDINFIFLKKVGRPLIKKVAVSDLINVAKELGWAK